MINKTEIANNALAYLSAGSIISIDDNDDEKSRVIRSVFDSVAKETIRVHRWSCCIKRATLSEVLPRPKVDGNFGYSRRFQLPSDSLRFLDLNGEPWNVGTSFLDINGRQLHTNAATANIRYVAWIPDTSLWDVLLAKTVAVAIAMRVARRLTKDGMSYENLYEIYIRTIAEAQKVDAMEVGSGENSPILKILNKSPIINSGRQSGGAFRIASRLGLDIQH